MDLGCLVFMIRDLTQQDGRMTKKCCTRLYSRSCATFFRPSTVLSLPAVLLSKVSIALRGQLAALSSSRFYNVEPIASANSGESGGRDKLEETIFNVKPADKRFIHCC